MSYNASYNTVLFAVEDGVAALTFNRPEKLNALNTEMLSEIDEVIDQVRHHPEIRALILTGQGRAFIAGADINEFLRFDPLAARQFADVGQAVAAKLEQLPVPVIACVNGFALGGGCELAMACDIIYASEAAKFGQPEVNLGIMPGFGGSQRLARLVGKGLAKELCLTGRVVDAAEAKAIGLAARVFPAATFMEECTKVARSLAAKGRFSLRSIKQTIDRGFDLDLKNACALEADAFALCFASPDAKEGAAAFLEKRKPNFL
ncbi:MAG: enoyl-CoA hydratase/isomerase family protein [Candidatus Portnoybacteria bacterium]|nr:enoyl-CoA hydratase/isomerase family protein [Candidatus Portnoybacteria bacterium]